MGWSVSLCEASGTSGSGRSVCGGDEVLVSAVTHPDMVRIIRVHGLRAVPVGLHTETLAPRPGALEAARRRRLAVYRGVTDLESRGRCVWEEAA